MGAGKTCLDLGGPLKDSVLFNPEPSGPVIGVGASSVTAQIGKGDINFEGWLGGGSSFNLKRPDSATSKLFAPEDRSNFVEKCRKRTPDNRHWLSKLTED